ncbi:hypothetical protein E2542_SST20315 [Spatholobus suberectus]|nr:hypothetical protein E2542_SST20315 [Spatholobus suberectus]
METPSSTTRRLTRSQTASNNIPVSRKKTEDSEKSVSKTRQRNNGQQQQDRGALVDISNDSPIVGLANGNDLETPLSSVAKQKRVKKTPGSGEALLRGQVKTLLQKVEEEAVISKLSTEIPPFLRLVNSPMSLLAPTPANTPQIPNLSGPSDAALALVSPPSSVVQEQLISRVVNEILEGKNNEKVESEKSVITRSLLLDFSDKSEVTYQEVTQGSGGGGGSTEDDGASIWSMQVNASTHDEDEEDDEGEDMAEEEEDYYEDAEGEECNDDDEGLLLDELCAGLNNISVNEKGYGRHTRFVYDSDDELVEKVEIGCCDQMASSNVLHLKGLPTPKGKHLRFPEEEENSDL